MPVYRNNLVLEIARNVKAFLNLEAGITRGKIAEPSANGSGAQNALRDQKLAESRKEISRLRKELAQANSKIQEQASASETLPMFFLFGRAKSGTSWLMRLLNAHPEVLCRGEGKLFGKESPRSLHGALTHSKDLQTWLTHNPWTLGERDPGIEEITGAAISYLMTDKLKKTKKKIVGDKTPLNLSADVVAEVATLCPGSKVLHIIRDGRDVAVSAVHHQWNHSSDEGGPLKIAPEQISKRDAFRENPGAFGSEGESIFGEGLVAKMAREWADTVDRVMRDGQNLLKDDYHQVLYEDLLTNPLEESKRILEFLGADTGEAVVRECVEATSFEKMASRKPGEEDPTSFFRKGVAGDWRGVFTEEDRRIFKEEAGETLIRLGYEKDDDW